MRDDSKGTLRILAVILLAFVGFAVAIYKSIRPAMSNIDEHAGLMFVPWLKALTVSEAALVALFVIATGTALGNWFSK